MNRIHQTFFAVIFAALAVISTCDMTYVSRGPAGVSVPDGKDDPDGKGMTKEERDELERSGHYLKLTSMPLNTQSSNVASVQIANSASPVAALNKNQSVRIFRETNYSTVYLPLAYSDNSAFVENGSFYVAFVIHVDAISSYVINVTDKIIVPFTDGRGELDVKMIPYKGIVTTDRRYLTIYNLPLNLLPQNVSKVSVNNRDGPIANCSDYSFVEVSTFGGSSTVSIPLSLINSSKSASVFSGTGNFYVVFDLFIDALTHYSVTAEDRVLVYFLDGNGYLDINGLASEAAAQRRFLTITGLPSNMRPRHVSNVLIHNQTAPVARLENYGLIEVLPSQNNTLSARIPLYYISPPSVFTESGGYIIVFDINIDADTSYTVTAQDRVTVSFLDGNGSFDVSNIPVAPVPCLTIRGLPLNTTKKHISEVYVYNLTQTVASCKNYNDIVTFNESGRVTAKIPLSSSGNVYFQDTGVFYISFTVNVDIENQIFILRTDNLSLNFIDGSAAFDVASTYGFFSAELANPSDTAKPVIKSDAEFDIDGYRHKIPANLTVPAAPPDNYSGILYLYAFHIGTDVYYEFSSAAPAFNAAKNGFYNGFKRALYKMVYLEEGNLFLFKTYVADNFSQFSNKVLTTSYFNALTASKSSYYYLSGSSNPGVAAITLPPGVYVARLNGAGGGGGYGSTAALSSKGGEGGNIDIIFTLGSSVPFSAFTGSAGSSTGPASFSGNLAFYGNANLFLHRVSVPSSGFGSEMYSIVRPSNILLAINVPITQPSPGGSGGSGGGSGTFLYSALGFFLCSGGGGGGSGQSFLTPGGAGGTGGVIGPGAGGGAGGYLQQPGHFSVAGSPGGNGGGLGGGLGGQCSYLTSNINGSDGRPLMFNGSDGNSLLFPTAASSIGTGAASYSPDDLVLSASSVPKHIIINSTYGGLDIFILQFPDPAELQTFFENLTSSQQNQMFLLNEPVMSPIPSPDLNKTASGGNGGATWLFVHGPNLWLNNNNANGMGANSPPLNLPSFSGSAYVDKTIIIETNYDGTETGSQGNPNYLIVRNNYFIADTFKNSTFAINLNPKAGLNGSDGGNNFNNNKGGGAAPGTAGSITIYKLY
jgi:hypothetical protein